MSKPPTLCLWSVKWGKEGLSGLNEMMYVKPWHLWVLGPLEKAGCQASLLCDCEGIRMLIFPRGLCIFKASHSAP